MSRSTFHPKHLEPFKEWLTQLGISWEDRAGVGDGYQVLGVRHNGHILGVYRRETRGNTEFHYSVDKRLDPLVSLFLAHRGKGLTVPEMEKIQRDLIRVEERMTHQFKDSPPPWER